MSEQRTVFLVEYVYEGSLWVAVFSTREKAQAFCPPEAEAFGFFVDETEVDERHEIAVRQFWRVAFREDGGRLAVVEERDGFEVAKTRLTGQGSVMLPKCRDAKPLFCGLSYVSGEHAAQLANVEWARWNLEKASQAKSEGGST